MTGLLDSNRGVVLVVAAHADDEVLGCGGTIARMVAAGHSVHVLLMADGETSRAGAGADVDARKVAERCTAADEACRILGCASVESIGLPDNRLDRLELLDVIKRIEAVLSRYQPTTVFTHHAGDVNIDHRIVHDAVLSACRPQPGHSVRELLIFEVPSSTEWRPPASGEEFSPNWFVDISSTLSIKLEALKTYKSELRPFPHPRSLRAVEALARWRGATAGMEAAEAFILARKLLR